MIQIGITILLFLLAGKAYTQEPVIFPSPETCFTGKGKFPIQPEACYSVKDCGGKWEYYFQETLAKEAHCKFVKTAKRKADFRFIKDSTLQEEAYILDIDQTGVQIQANSEEGFFYALQTLRQILEKTESGTKVQALHITDGPRYRWRSFMLDSGRQYQQVATIKKYIDMAATLKMNYFHWHLTEGSGWRTEIKKYPLLTGKGAFIGQGTGQKGFYSQQEIRDLVQYASDRYVTIVPEIDMPGHAEAAIYAYPETSCFGKIPSIPKEGFTPDIFCAGKDSTIRFLQNILDEVCMLFPSTYIHLGGDEAPKDNWNKCPDCQKRIKENGLKDSHELQGWFTAQMAEYLKNKGRKAIFYGDVLVHSNIHLPDNVVIHWWNWRNRKDHALRQALEHNLSVICGTNYYTYLNFPVTPWKGYQADRTFDLQDAYEKNPSMKRDTNRLVIGMSCALWTDYGVTEDMLDQRIFPRILALAGQMWYRGEDAPFEVFYKNIMEKKGWFNQLGFEFGPALKNK